MGNQDRARPPVAKTAPTTIETHGDVRVDEYAWLRDLSDPDTLAYLEAENAYTEAMLAHTGDLQETLYKEMVGRIKETDESARDRWDDYWYSHRTVEGLQYAIHCRRLGPDGPEQVILDENELAAGHGYFRVGVFSPSPDHSILAYSFDVSGSEQYRMVFKDLATGELLPDVIENTSYSSAWAGDNRSFFYTVLDEAKRPFKVMRHVLGADPADDVCVHHETDDAFFAHVARTRSRRFILIHVASNTTSEALVIDANDPGSTFRLVEPRRTGVEYYVDHQGDRFVLRTNDDAVDFKVVDAPIDSPGRASWRDVIPHREGVKIEEIDPFADHLVTLERADGLNRIRVDRVSTGESHLVEMPEPAYTLSPAMNAMYDTTIFRFSYASLVTPPSVFDYDMVSRARTLVKQQEVLGDFDPADYVTERIHATAPDGVRVPISLVARRDRARDGGGPGLLYGYGSYGYSIDASFSSARLSLLDRGYVYAISHVRGGGDLGEGWKLDGKLLRKKNSFTDFIACAEHLIAEGYVARDRLAIQGGSAGGLLMGAVTNMRPDLFTAVIAQVPFVDVVNTMLDASIPLTVIEYDEWGNPNDPTYYDYIRSYSPYDNVEAKAYPNLLVMAGLNDPRVHYWEPAKWVARLRARKTDENMLVLKTQMGAGHAGPSGRYDYLREVALQYAFILEHTA